MAVEDPDYRIVREDKGTFQSVPPPQGQTVLNRNEEPPRRFPLSEEVERLKDKVETLGLTVGFLWVISLILTLALAYLLRTT